MRINGDFSSRADLLIVCQNSRIADPTLFSMVSADIARWRILRLKRRCKRTRPFRAVGAVTFVTLYGLFDCSIFPLVNVMLLRRDSWWVGGCGFA